MKYFVVLLAVFLFCANPSLQISQFNGNCTSQVMGLMQDDCINVHCDGANVHAVPCSLYRCMDDSIGDKEQNNSKSFPYCCPGSICGDLTYENTTAQIVE